MTYEQLLVRMPTELYEELEEFCEKEERTKSGTIRKALKDYFEVTSATNKN